ncbi:MAG: cell division protein FtsL [Proteobacteria bacterium]|nr:cell division protein FtsL [Pseudomonadota bacterium]
MRRVKGRRATSNGKGKLSLKSFVFLNARGGRKKNSFSGNTRAAKKPPTAKNAVVRFGSRLHSPRPPTAEKTPASYLCVVCVVVALVCAAFVFHLHVRFEGVRLGYLTSQARVHKTRLLVERRELRLELASLKAPKHVESEAREKLDMEMPDYRRIVTIGSKRKAVLASGRAR